MLLDDPRSMTRTCRVHSRMAKAQSQHFQQAWANFQNCGIKVANTPRSLKNCRCFWRQCCNSKKVTHTERFAISCSLCFLGLPLLLWLHNWLCDIHSGMTLYTCHFDSKHASELELMTENQDNWPQRSRKSCSWCNCSVKQENRGQGRIRGLPNLFTKFGICKVVDTTNRHNVTQCGLQRDLQRLMWDWHPGSRQDKPCLGAFQWQKGTSSHVCNLADESPWSPGKPRTGEKLAKSRHPYAYIAALSLGMQPLEGCLLHRGASEKSLRHWSILLSKNHSSPRHIKSFSSLLITVLMSKRPGTAASSAFYSLRWWRLKNN